ncbi:hypothetical protein D3C85_1433970 [compost metagenome]
MRFCGMIDEPVVRSSGREAKPNIGVIQTTISSARRDRWPAAIEAAARLSSAKSRSETASRLLAIGRSKPRALAVMWRSMGKGEPARAAAPSGFSFMRVRASEKRLASRPNIST